MKALAKVVAGIALFAVLLLGLLAWALPRLVQTEEFDRALRAAAERAVGSPVDWKHVEVGLLPPRLMLDSPVLTSRRADPEKAKLEIGAVDLRLALLPILQRRIQIDSLVLRNLDLVVTRAESGWILPIGGDAAPETPGAGSPDPAPEGSDFDLSLRRLIVEGGRVVVQDLTQSEPATWQLNALELVAQGDSLDEPVVLEASARLAANGNEAGQVEVAGTASLAGAYDMEAKLAAFPLAVLGRYVSDIQVAGLAAGRVSARGASEAPISFDLDLGVEALLLESRGVALDGTLSLQARGAGTEPIGFSGDLALGDGGHARFTGQRASNGALDAKVDLEAIGLARFAPLAGEGVQLQGQATGDTAIATTAAGDLDSLEVRLKVPDLRFTRDQVDIAGALALVSSTRGADPIQIDAGLTWKDGGRVGARGTSSRDAVVDLELTFERFDLANLKAFLPGPETRVAGRVSGSGRLVGAAAEPESLALNLEVAEGSLQRDDYRAEGPLTVALDVKAPLSDRPRGRLDLDLTKTALSATDRFEKRAGQRATVATKFSRTDSGQLDFESNVKLRNTSDIRLVGFVGDATAVTITTPPLDLAEWSETLIALKPYSPTGSLRFDRFRVQMADAAPSRWGGRVELSPVDVLIPDQGRVELRGQLVGDGTAIRAQDLKARSSGLELGVTGKLEDPLGAARYQFALRSIGEPETNELLSSLTSVKDTLFGVLNLDAQLSGAAGGAGSFADSIDGRLSFSIGQQKGGRLRGASILRRVLEQFPILAGAAKFSEPFRGGRSIASYFREEFKILQGDLEVAGGVVKARKLRLAYDGYDANLSGSLRLEDLGLDMTGELLLESQVVSLLARAAGTELVSSEPLRIPLARVTRTLSDPKVAMTPETLAAIPKHLVRTKGEELLRKGVSDALGRVLGGGSRKAGGASPVAPQKEAEKEATEKKSTPESAPAPAEPSVR